jgi:hypothetical protein
LSYKQKLLGYEGKLLGYEGKLLSYGGKLLSYEGKLLSYEGKLLSYEGKLLSHKEKLLGYKGKFLGYEGKFLGYEVRDVALNAGWIVATLREGQRPTATLSQQDVLPCSGGLSVAEARLVGAIAHPSKTMRCIDRRALLAYERAGHCLQ